MVEKEFTIVNKLGFHARAAVKFVQMASQFKADVKIRKDNMTVCGKSIMGVLMLAAAKGTTLNLIIEGDDEDRALKILGELIEDGFGEEH